MMHANALEMMIVIVQQQPIIYMKSKNRKLKILIEYNKQLYKNNVNFK